jgi:hypothetical protein
VLLSTTSFGPAATAFGLTKLARPAGATTVYVCISAAICAFSGTPNVMDSLTMSRAYVYVIKVFLNASLD